MGEIELGNVVVHVARAVLRRGFPVYVKPLGRQHVFIELPGKRRAVYKIHPVLDVLSNTITGVAIATTWDYGGVPIASIAMRGKRIEFIKPYYADFILALAQYEHMMRSHEVDIWRLRVMGYERIRIVDNPPKHLAVLAKTGLTIGFLEETCDYTVMASNVVAIWVNECTGRIDVAYDWQDKMKVFSWSKWREVLEAWLRKVSD